MTEEEDIMQKLIGFIRWGNWVVLLGDYKTLVISSPKNLVVRIREEMSDLSFEGDKKGPILIGGPARKITEFIENLGGKSFIF